MLLVIAAGATCSDSPTGISVRPVRLALAPHFTGQAAAIYRNLTAFDVTLDNVHVVVSGCCAASDGPGPLLEDTTIAFPASANEITIDLDLTIATQQANVVASIELRQGTTAYFAGSQSFLAKQGETATAPEPVEMGYVGPGATGAFMTITPGSPTLAPSSSFQFAAHVTDNLEHVVTDLPLSWSTSDATIATVSQSGLVTSTGKTGTVTLTATGLNGLSQETPIRVQPVASLIVAGGANQSATAGGALTAAFEVQALDATQTPVIGAPITFAPVNAAGSVSPTSATTDVNGYASTTVTLGSAIGTYTFTAQTGGGTVQARIVATASAAAPASLGIVSGNQQADTVLATLGQPLTVRVADSFGNPVANQIVDFMVTSGQAGLLTPGSAGPLTQAQVTTGTDGTASVSLVAGAVAGTVHVAAVIPNTSFMTTFEETLEPGVASTLAMVQQPSPTAQATITLGRQPKVQVTDLYGNPVALQGLTILASPSVDCSAGAVCTRVVPPRTGGALLNRGTTPSSVPRTPTPRRPSLTRAIPSASRLTVPVEISRTQSVSDTFPQGLGGTTQAVTDASGVASFTDLSLNLSVGPWVLVFYDANETLGAATSSDIALSPGPIESIIAWSADTAYNFFPGDTLYPSVRVIDKVGNGIPNVPVTWTVQDGVSKLDSANTTTRTDANGVASGGDWYTPAGVAGIIFEIIATPNPSSIENSPLHLYGAPLQPIGAARVRPVSPLEPLGLNTSLSTNIQ